MGWTGFSLSWQGCSEGNPSEQRGQPSENLSISSLLLKALHYIYCNCIPNVLLMTVFLIHPLAMLDLLIRTVLVVQPLGVPGLLKKYLKLTTLSQCMKCSGHLEGGGKRLCNIAKANEHTIKQALHIFNLVVRLDT